MHPRKTPPFWGAEQTEVQVQTGVSEVERGRSYQRSECSAGINTMAKLTPIPAREVICKLRQLGYEGPYGGGKHSAMRHPETGKKIPIPVHANRDLPIGTLREIVSIAKVSVKEWESL